MRIISNHSTTVPKQGQEPAFSLSSAQHTIQPAFVPSRSIQQHSSLSATAGVHPNSLAQPSDPLCWPAQTAEETPDSAISLDRKSRKHTRTDSRNAGATYGTTNDVSSGAQNVRLPAVAFVPTVCLFVQHLFQGLPILAGDLRHRTPESILYTTLDREFYSFLCALSALTVAILRSHFNLASIPFGHSSSWFAKSSVREFNHVDAGGRSDRLAIRTTCLLSLYHWQFEQVDLAWYYLNEAITLMQIRGFDQEAAYMRLNESDNQEWRRLYWILFMLERRQAVRLSEQFRLRNTVALPVVVEDAALLVGFYANARLLATLQNQPPGPGKLMPQSADISPVFKALEAVREIRQIAPQFEYLQRITAWTTCVWIQLRNWQSAQAVSHLLGTCEVGTEMDRDLPMQLLVETCHTLCVNEPSTLEPLGIDMYLDTIDVANAVIERLLQSDDTAVATWTGKLQYLNRFVTWLERAETRPVKAFEQLQLKMQRLHQAFAASQQKRAQEMSSDCQSLNCWVEQAALPQEQTLSPLALLPAALGDACMSSQLYCPTVNDHLLPP